MERRRDACAASEGIATISSRNPGSSGRYAKDEIEDVVRTVAVHHSCFQSLSLSKCFTDTEAEERNKKVAPARLTHGLLGRKMGAYKCCENSFIK